MGTPIKKLFLYLLLVTFLFHFSCERISSPIPVSQKSTKRPLTAEETTLISSDNRFGIKLFKNLIASSGDSNVIVSPLSISMALGMTLNGAAGETRTAMEKTLELEGLTQEQINESYRSLINLLLGMDPQVIFKIANSIWYREGLVFKQNFIDLNKKYFSAQVQGLNFSDPNSVSIINSWVNDNTGGKIKEIIKNIAPENIMFLINAIYFKGIWTYQFDPELTLSATFYTPAGNEFPCDMMQQAGDFAYLETDEFQAVDLPYGAGDFRMAIFLPKHNQNINSLIAGMDNETLSNWLQQFSDKNGILELPRFKLSYEKKLNELLCLLGMEIAFDDWRADFTNLYAGPGNAYISEVRHKTFIQLDEEGTEAAAVTSVTISYTSVGGSDNFYMRVDRPFLFIIHDAWSNSILFIGKITEPEWES
jgi:serine protease inhibitor